MNTSDLTQYIKNGNLDEKLKQLYGEYIAESKERYVDLVKRYENKFGEGSALQIFSTPGRTEIGGNHTDHQHGRVIAAAVGLDIIAVVAETDDGIIRVQSRGHDLCEVDLNNLEKASCEENSSVALVRGIAAKITSMGYKLRGFNAYTTTKVLRGSGLSSSAAFEVLVSNIINQISCNSELTGLQMAQISQFAENTYYGKPCGLMDQAACAIGGFISIDFKDPEKPLITPVNFDLSKHGYKLIIVNTKGNHGDLSDDYAAIPAEMKQVANAFKKETLREVNEADFNGNIVTLREKVSDRAILRAMHFFGDNNRVLDQIDALQKGDINKFLKEVKNSGQSSMVCLQNIFSTKNPCEQNMTLALAVTYKFLKDQGACRVHGGGFAGTIQVYVKTDYVFDYVKTMNELFGENCCYVLNIREMGTMKVI